MKRFLVSLIIVSMLGFNSIAYAAEEGQTVNAGITPDSILYSADKLFEDLQLAFTPSSEKQAELLLQFAQERLAEAKVMTEEEKDEYVKIAINDYEKTLDSAEDKVTEVAADESTTQEVKDDLSQQLEDTATVDKSVEGSLDTQQQEQVEEKTAEASYTASVVKDLDPEVVKTLRDKGMGFGNIAHTVALAKLSGKSVDEVAAMIEEGKGIGKIAKELGIHPSKMNKASETASQDGETTDGTTTEGTTAGSSQSTADGTQVQATAVQAVTNSQTTANQTLTTNVKTSGNVKNVKTTGSNKKTAATQQGTSKITSSTSGSNETKEVIDQSSTNKAAVSGNRDEVKKINTNNGNSRGNSKSGKK